MLSIRRSLSRNEIAPGGDEAPETTSQTPTPSTTQASGQSVRSAEPPKDEIVASKQETAAAKVADPRMPEVDPTKLSESTQALYAVNDAVAPSPVLRLSEEEVFSRAIKAGGAINWDGPYAESKEKLTDALTVDGKPLEAADLEAVRRQYSEMYERDLDLDALSLGRDNNDMKYVEDLGMRNPTDRVPVVVER